MFASEIEVATTLIFSLGFLYSIEISVKFILISKGAFTFEIFHECFHFTSWILSSDPGKGKHSEWQNVFCPLAVLQQEALMSGPCARRKAN